MKLRRLDRWAGQLACDVGIPSSNTDWHVPLCCHIGSMLAEGETRKHLQRSGPRRKPKDQGKGMAKRATGGGGSREKQTETTPHGATGGEVGRAKQSRQVIRAHWGAGGDPKLGPLTYLQAGGLESRLRQHGFHVFSCDEWCWEPWRCLLHSCFRCVTVDTATVVKLCAPFRAQA